MSEPILSREEVDALWVCRHNGLDTPISFEDSIYNFAANLESALLEKLRGEPVAFVCSASNDFAPIIRDKTAAQKLSDEHGDGKIAPLYTLKGQS
ncbi:hypothetical protein WK78_29035 [Burkholderia cepacia]|uniref:hypothetical protein n=1 Tax=Burkholderia cepacia TaxID=292 RepID=UPI000752AFEB|nr:hypothetical protein [Burkholderia cepacia]KVV20331.1 hypothetical protein WK78_29035 [Burkholderia cepacia]